MSETAVLVPETPSARANLLVCLPSGQARAQMSSALESSGTASVAFASPDDADATNIQLNLPTDTGSLLPWFTRAEAMRSVAEAGHRAGAERCLLLGFDATELDPADLQAMAEAILQPGCAAVSPVYAAQPAEGLLNTAVIYPMLRALYGRRVRYPLAGMVGISTELAGRMAAQARGGAALFPVLEAAAQDLPICQARVAAPPPQVAAGRDAEEILSGILGPVFTDMEMKAPLWQRTRSTEEPRSFGRPQQPAHAETDPSAELPRMIEQFQLATRNLAGVWSLVMPPATLFSLKRLGSGSDTFHMPDALWARVVYDFALAHRTRVISRQHLFGAFTPLYLAWIASFLSGPQENADARVEQQARAFEQEKLYLLQRWRWPDRFNP